MTLAGIPVTATSANGPPSVPRRSGGYAPTVWSNEFIQSLNSQFPDAHANRHGELMEKTRNMLSECNEHLSLIKLLDWLQKLGVAYHFKDYIYKLLGDLSNHMTDILEKGDLNHISILFVLLRNNGFVVSQDIFKGFFDQENQLSIMKCNDYRGILSLYEASFLSYDGEVILNNVRELCIEYLKNLYEETTIDTLKETIKRSLEIPLHRRIMRLEIHQFIKMYAMEKDMSPVLLEFAQLDYNKVQCVHMDEVKRASRWWDEIGFKGNIQFFRDRIVECWIWAIGIASHEPKSSYCREHLTKLTALIALLDDLYDIYGTMD
nr:terpene synthase [Alisma plantago-aquatica subsp. orientale]